MDDLLLREFCTEHMAFLQNKLKEIYTIDTPELLKEEEDGEKVNINEKLSTYRFMEAVYANIEQTEEQEGEIYERYQTLLDNLRSKKQYISELKDEIEKKHEADIRNIKIMIDAFHKEM